MTGFVCPVCGPDELTARPYTIWPPPPNLDLSPPYEDLLGQPSYEVCPQCGYEFGNDDNPGIADPQSFESYRLEWELRGSPRFRPIGDRLSRSGIEHDPSVADPGLRESGAQASENLEAARALLIQPEGEGIEDYREYLTHNELRLAFDVLVEVGARQRAPQRFWKALHDVSTEMKLTPDSRLHGSSIRTIQQWTAKAERYPCPCCGYLVFEEEPGSYDICQVCGWEDDLSQLRFPEMGGANAPLIECQAEFASSLVSAQRRVPSEEDGLVQDLGWRPLDPTRDAIERPAPGLDYGDKYSDDRTVYYYWRTQRT